jgi:hyperosmotically inducible protein
VARSVDGVRSVTNNLAVQAQSRTAGEVVDDGVLTTKVKAALVADPRTKAREINVETRDGVVQLNGFVDDQATMTAAVAIARGIDGVREVRSGLQVKTR